MPKNLILQVLRSMSKEPRLLSSLLVRYSNSKIFCYETLNQLFRLAHSSRIYKLTTIGIETNNTCNLTCIHCPTNREMKRKKGYMELETFKKIIDLSPEVGRVYLTNWGEPLIHPKIVEMIRYAHIKGKQTALTTNGTVLHKSLTRELLESGLNIIKFSVDGCKKTYEKIRGFPYEKLESNILQFFQMRNELKKHTWVEVSMVMFNETFTEIDSFFKKWKKHADFVNIQPKFLTIKKKIPSLCKDLWRILVVLWNGNVAPCCVDFEGELIIGDATKESLQKLFKGPLMTELRKKHLRKQLPSLCIACSHYLSDYHVSKKFVHLKNHDSEPETF